MALMVRFYFFDQIAIDDFSITQSIFKLDYKLAINVFP